MMSTRGYYYDLLAVITCVDFIHPYSCNAASTQIYFFIYVAYKRRYFLSWENQSWDSDRFTCFQHPSIWKKWLLECHLYVHMSVLVHKWMHGFYSHSVFTSLSTVGHCSYFKWTLKTNLWFSWKQLKLLLLNFSNLWRKSP